MQLANDPVLTQILLQSQHGRVAGGYRRLTIWPTSIGKLSRDLRRIDQIRHVQLFADGASSVTECLALKDRFFACVLDCTIQAATFRVRSISRLE